MATWNSPSFNELTPDGQINHDLNYTAPSTDTTVPMKAGTIVTQSASTDTEITVHTAAPGTALVTEPWMILLCNVRDLDAGAVSGYRVLVNSEKDLGDPIRVARSGVFAIGPQVAADDSAGYVEDITAADVLFADIDASGAGLATQYYFAGGISKTATRGSTYYSSIIGWAKNAATFASGTILEFVFAPQLVNTSLV